MTAAASHAVLLRGCRTRPLAGYLKALGVHRLVAEQADPQARSEWGTEGLVLYSRLDEAGLRAFFLEQYRPTPVISPWNGGSGFYPKDNQDGIGPMSSSTDPRYADYREAVEVARGVMQGLGVSEKSGDMKEVLLERLRAELPDAALAWLDAAVLLTADRLRFPPLLGTGGNDGRFDFSNNFMQRLVELATEKPAVRATLLDNSLFDTATSRLSAAATGQFLPAGAGGFNTGFGFKAESRVNPWDFVLLLEGALAFAAAAVRKLEGAGAPDLVFPFMVQAAAAGYGSATVADEASTRQELWLPVWTSPASWRSLRQLFSEGRALVSSEGRRRPAVNALDFARALGELGVDRGISAFERYGFLVRNGLSTLAVPLGLWRVPEQPSDAAGRFDVLDPWITRFREKASSDRAPASLARLRRRLDTAILELCEEDSDDHKAALLVVLGAIEAQLGRSRAWAKEQGVNPVPWLGGAWSPTEETVEGRLARALAGHGLRYRYSPVKREGRGRFLEWADHPDVGMVWTGNGLAADLEALVLRLDVERSAAPGDAVEPRAPVGLADVAAFLAGEVDDDRIAELALGYALIEPAALARAPHHNDGVLPPLYPLLALVADPRPIPIGETQAGGQPLPRVPGLVRRALSGQAEAASVLALRRLRASGMPAAAFNRRRLGSRDTGIAAPVAETRRAGQALAFPLTLSARRILAAAVLVKPDSASGSHNQESA